MRKDVFVMIPINEEEPLEKEKGLSEQVLTFDKNKKFLGEDTYNTKLHRWLISRDTAKYWLKKV